MANEYPIALRKMSEDGKYRLTVRYDECAEHPLCVCDFPLHMDDWNGDYSANPTRMSKVEEHFRDRAECMRYLVNNFGDVKKIIDRLIANGRKEKHDRYEEALIYDRGRREWLFVSWVPTYQSYTGESIGAHWAECESYDCKRECLDMYSLTCNMSEEMLSILVEHCLTDEVKVMSYFFDYHGSIGFCSDVCATSDGLAWIEKSEAVGDGKWLTDEQWRTEDCYSLTNGEREEIVAWADGNVFWFEVEKAVKWKTHRECLSEEREPECYEETEWKRIDSCSGFYGLDYAEQYAIEENNLPKMLEAA